MWNGVSRRRFPRVSAPLLINIYHNGHEESLTTKTESVGQGGLSAPIDQDLGLATLIHVKFILPKTSKMIECQGKVVWIIQKRFSDNGVLQMKFDTGIEFVNLKKEDKTLIEKLVGESDLF